MSKFLKSYVTQWVVSLGIFLGLLFLLSKQIPLSNLKEILAGLRWQWVLGALVIYFLSTIVRSQRFRVLGLDSIPLLRFSRLSLIYYFLSNALPFRSGELSFIYLIKKESTASLSVSLSVLLLSRIFDFLAVIVWLIISIIVLFPSQVSSGDPIILGSSAILAMLLLALGFLLFGRKIVGQILGFGLRQLHGKFPGLEQKFLNKWSELGEALDILKKKKVFAKVFFYSVAGWFILYFITIFFMFALGKKISFWQSAFITSFPPIASLIPLGTPGNFGTVEAGWVFGLKLIGFDLALSITLSLALHILTILLQSFSALFAFLYKRFS